MAWREAAEATFVYFVALYLGHLHGRTDSQQTRQEPNGNITATQDTPDDGPVRARNV
jgi:hypothetical protein